MRLVMTTALVLAPVALPVVAQTDSTMLRATTVTVFINQDPEPSYNGVFRAQSISNKCGLADYGAPHRANSFAVRFPDDGTIPLAVTTVSFDADTLPAGATSTSFYLDVGIRVGQATPPSYIIRANESQYNEPGTATLFHLPNGVDSLIVNGTATKGRKVQVRMIVVCQP